MKRFWIVVLAAVGLSAALGLRSLGPKEGDGPWARVERQDLVVGVEVTGTLGAIESVDLGPPQIQDVWDFKISFLAPEGAEVQPGQPVLGFDTSDLENRLVEKQAERDAAEKELEKKLKAYEAKNWGEAVTRFDEARILTEKAEEFERMARIGSISRGGSGCGLSAAFASVALAKASGSCGSTKRTSMPWSFSVFWNRFQVPP